MKTGPGIQVSFRATHTAVRAFDGARLEHLWTSLTEDDRDQILTKARWEGLPRAAVIRNWWPDLWAEIAIYE